MSSAKLVISLVEKIKAKNIATAPALVQFVREDDEFHHGIFSLLAPILNPATAPGAKTIIDLAETVANTELSAELSVFDCVLLGIVWRYGSGQGWYDTDKNIPAPFLPDHLHRIVTDAELKYCCWNVLIVLLGYNLGSSAKWNENLLKHYLVPEIVRLLENGNYTCAMFMARLIESCSYQQPHTIEQAKACYGMTSRTFREAGERLAARFTRSAPITKTRLPKQESPVVVFLSELPVHPGALTGALMNLLLGESRQRTFTPVICSLGGFFDVNFDFLANAKIGVIDLHSLRGDARGDDFAGRMLTLRQLLERHNATALVYYNTADAFANFVSALCLAPVQIYLSMGLHYIDHRFFDGLITRGAAGQTRKIVDGITWRTYEWIRQGHADSPALVASGKKLKAAKFPADRIILGTMCRPAKIDNDEFMDALAEILHANGNTLFLWFGTEELTGVRQRMEARDISERCLFAGFVQVQEYAQVLDIHLDAFPFPCGGTMVDTMYYGVPYVLMDCEEAWQTGLVQDIKPLIDGRAGSLSKIQMRRIRQIFNEPVTGELLAPIAANRAEYVALASRLISDLAYRNAVGKAARQFITEFKADLDVGTRTFFNQCREIIANKRIASAQKP